MVEALVSLQNKNPRVRLTLPDGKGNQINLAPGETRLVRGDPQYFKRMPAQGVHGLVVKVQPGGVGEGVDTVAYPDYDVRRCKVTNHRNIPIELATGVERKNVRIAPKQTVELTGRVSLMKGMSGISIRIIEEKKEVPAPKGETKPVAGSEQPAAGEAKAAVVEGEEKKEAAKPPIPPIDAKSALRQKLDLPATVEEFQARSRQLTWHDLRAITRELGLKSGGGRDDLIAGIAKELY